MSATLTSAQRNAEAASQHAALAEELLALTEHSGMAPVGIVQLRAQKAAAHASLAIYYQREADR